MRSKSHTSPDTEFVTILYKCQFSILNSNKRTWKTPNCSRQLLVRVCNHTLFLIWSVSQFSTKYQFNELNSHQCTFENLRVCSRQLLVRVVNHTLLLIRKAWGFSTWYWPHSGGHLSLKWVLSLANCVDIASRPQGPVKEAFAFLCMSSWLPRKLRRYPFKTTRIKWGSILQTCKSNSLARWNEISFVPKLPVSSVKRHFWK